MTLGVKTINEKKIRLAVLVVRTSGECKVINDTFAKEASCDCLLTTSDKR